MNNLSKWNQLFCKNKTPVYRINDYGDVEITIKRDELNHSIIQGNKLRKLKYNILYALENNKSYIATFGGAWSNHIIATAKAAMLCNLKSIGFIRGDELQGKPQLWSNTLQRANDMGMEFVFLSRKEYRLKQQSKLVNLAVLDRINDVYFVPEGGSNLLALQGVSEIISELKSQIPAPTHIITPCGTGGTMAGLIEGVAMSQWDTKIIGVPVLKNALFIRNDMVKLISKEIKVDWQLYTEYHFGGYAKYNQDLRQFGLKFINNTGIDLDKVYTVKSFYAAYDLIDKGEIPPKSRLLLLHTGGLQGGSIIDAN